MTKKLAQDDAVMFERNISIIASKTREIVACTAAGVECVGFVAGLDDEWIQICRSEDGTSMSLLRRDVIEVSETGQTLHDFPEDVRTKIRDRTRMFSVLSTRHTDKFNK